MAHHTHDPEKEGCHSMLDSLSLYLDGEAEDALCREIERHMSECENCRVVIDTMAKTIKLYQEHSHTQLSGEARRRLYVALDLSDFLKDGG